MKNVIVLHGRPTKEIYYSADFETSSNFAWIPWLQKQLLINDIKADAPEVPFAFDPNYEVWKKEVERFDVNEETILIGHSAGASFMVRWFSENKVKIDKLILVAPGMSFLRDNLDLIDRSLVKRTNDTIMFISDHDPGTSEENKFILMERIDNMRQVEIKGAGHFIPEHMGTVEFPDLLNEILK